MLLFCRSADAGRKASDESAEKLATSAKGKKGTSANDDGHHDVTLIHTQAV